jgi:membrane-bound transcription factor site-1 protease
VLRVPVSLRVGETPQRRRRLLFDLYHSSHYPSGFFPNDDLTQSNAEMMDWNGDHPHTNFRSLHGALRRAGFSVELLTSNFSSFDASRYGALLLIDPEEPYHPSEARKLVDDVTRRGLGLLVAADWHDPALMRQLRYTDEHTHADNVCASGGANVPALNRLLAPLGVGFRSVAMSGSVTLGGRAFDYLSGAAISAFPAGGFLLHASLTRITKLRQPSRGLDVLRVAVLGLHQPRGAAAGWVLAFGDSSCLDDSVPHAKWPVKQQCVAPMVELLSSLLPADGRAPTARPALLSHATLLREAYADSGARAGEGNLSVEQAATLRAQSRVYGRIAGYVADRPL